MSASSAVRSASRTGRQAARLCALNILTHLKTACGGDLDRVKRVVRLGGFVNCTPDFTDQPQVVNGASNLMVEVFGDAGRHARAAVGVSLAAAGGCGRGRSHVRDRLNAMDTGEQVALTVHPSIGEIPAAEWDACAGDINPTLSHTFLQAMEESGSATARSGWAPQHLSLADSERARHRHRPALSEEPFLRRVRL